MKYRRKEVPENVTGCLRAKILLKRASGSTSLGEKTHPENGRDAQVSSKHGCLILANHILSGCLISAGGIECPREVGEEWIVRTRAHDEIKPYPRQVLHYSFV